MPPSKSSTAAVKPQVSDYHDTSSDDISEPEPTSKSAPVPPLPTSISTTTSKSPTVSKNQASTNRPSSSRRTQEPLVRASKKSAPDSSKGAYAPIGTSTLSPPSDGSELSEFSSDPENQAPPPPSKSRSSRGGANTGRAVIEDEHEASEEEQEEEKQGRPVQTAAQRRNRTLWCWGLGGVAVIIIIVIGVVIYFLNSGKSSSSDSTSSRALNSTSELDHTSNSTSSSHNSTSNSRNSTLSHNNSPMSLDEDSMAQTALPANETGSATGAEELETSASPTRAIGSTASSLTEGSETNAPLSPTDESAQAAPTGESSVNNESIRATTFSTAEKDTLSGSTLPTNYDSQSSTAVSDAAHAVPTSLSSPSGTTNLDYNASPAQTTPVYGVQSTRQGVVIDPIRSIQGDPDGASQVGSPATIDSQQNVPPSPVPALELTPVESASALPTEYLRPTPPQASVSGGSNEGGHGSNQQGSESQPQATEVGSAWWPAPTLATDPNDPEQKTNKSTRWIGNATWFVPADADEACQVQYDDSDFVVALSTEIYGDSQSVSAFCGAKVNVWNPYTNETASATVLGVCEDCQGPTDINLSQSLFSELDSPDIGVLDAIYFKETEWKGSCGITVGDDSLSVALPLSLWSDPSKPSKYCGKKITLKNTASGALIEAQVVEASNRTDYTILTQIAFEHLGGNAENGEMPVQFWFN
ncbi:hypothetical protein JCM5350_007453 [Sporobolomyces pararoseus]